MNVAQLYPDLVDRLVLAASSGLSEAWPMPSVWGAQAVARLGKLLQWTSTAVPGLASAFHTTGLSKVCGYMLCVEKAPTYGVMERMPAFLAAHGIAVSLIFGAFDVLHTAQLERWRPAKPHCIVVTPMPHSVLCVSLDGLRLEERPSMWHGPLLPRPRSRL